MLIIGERIGVLRGFKAKNILDTSRFCEFQLLNGFFILKTMFLMNSGTRKSFCVIHRSGDIKLRQKLQLHVELCSTKILQILLGHIVHIYLFIHKNVNVLQTSIH